MLWIRLRRESGSFLPSLRFHPAPFLWHAIDEPDAGTHQGEQPRPV